MDNFNFADLSSATIADELNPLAYSPGDYPAIHDMLSSMEFNSDKIVPINPLSMAVNGLIIQDPMQKYLDKKSNSSSALKEVLKTPFHYKFHTEIKQEEKKKDHFELGTFAHMAFMEPDLFKKVIIGPSFPLNSLDGVRHTITWFEKTNMEDPKNTDGWKMYELKAYLEELQARCKYELINEDQQAIVSALEFGYKHYGGGIIGRILKGAMAETSFYGKDESTGLPVKVRPDFFNIEENIGVNAVISFKTTSSQSLGKFIYDSARFQYELSEGMYQEVMSNITGRKFNVTILIMLQTVPPYLPAVFWWDAEDLQNGKYKYRSALETVKRCKDSMSFPGYDSAAESGNYGIIEMKQPDWAMKELHPVDIDD